MIILQTAYKTQVSQLLADKEHVTSSASSEMFLSTILAISIGFAVLAAGMTIYMLIRRKMMNQKKTSETVLKNKYQDFLSSFFTLPVDDAFVGITSNNQSPIRLDRIDVTSAYRRKLLAQEIFNFKKQLRGQQESQLSNYFFGLGLQKEAIDLTYSSSWTDKIKGMQFINEFKIQEGSDAVDSLINNKNKEIAIHAIIVRISLDRNISVLDKIERKLNAWEWHKIVHKLQQLKLSQVDFTSLLNSNVQDSKLITIASQALTPTLDNNQLSHKQIALF